MNEKDLLEAINSALKDKGKRKFLQSMELIINFKNVDFSRPENRLSLDVKLPREVKKTNIVIIAEDRKIISEVKERGDVTLIKGSDLQNYTKAKMKKLAENSEFFVEPKLMAEVGKKYKFLPQSGRMRPLINIKTIDQVKGMVHIRSKGKYIPTVQCIVGHENMKPEEILENAIAVINSIKGRIPESNFRSIYFKLTMGSPVKVIA
jgi:large subunit ribosomal protein L1